MNVQQVPITVEDREHFLKAGSAGLGIPDDELGELLHTSSRAQAVEGQGGIFSAALPLSDTVLLSTGETVTMTEPKVGQARCFLKSMLSDSVLLKKLTDNAEAFRMSPSQSLTAELGGCAVDHFSVLMAACAKVGRKNTRGEMEWKRVNLEWLDELSLEDGARVVTAFRALVSNTKLLEKLAPMLSEMFRPTKQSN